MVFRLNGFESFVVEYWRDGDVTGRVGYSFLGRQKSKVVPTSKISERGSRGLARTALKP